MSAAPKSIQTYELYHILSGFCNGNIRFSVKTNRNPVLCFGFWCFSAKIPSDIPPNHLHFCKLSCKSSLGFLYMPFSLTAAHGVIYFNQPCFCLCLGFSQMTMTRPLRLIILHFSQMGFTEGLTFIVLPPYFIQSISSCCAR